MYQQSITQMRGYRKGDVMFNGGFKHFINHDKVLAAVDFSAKSQPIIRAINSAKDMGMLIDITMGRKTNTVIFVETGHVILSHSISETISKRIKEAKQC